VTQPGDRVVVVSDNSAAMVVALYAVPLAGAIATFANTRHTPAELGELLRATRPTVVAGSAEQLARLADLPELASVATVLRLEELTDRDAAPDRASSPSPAPAPAPPVPLAADDCAWLIHTSGTTGRAKGVMLTHRSLLTAVANTAVARPMQEDDVYLFPFPLFHVAAYNVLHSHLRRRPVVLLPRFDAQQVLDAVRAEGVTTCSLAPTMLAMLLDRTTQPSVELASLRQISYGASAMPLDLLRRVQAELPDCGLAQGYGMTELSGNAVFLDPAAHRRAARDEPHLLAAAGRPGPLVALRIVDDEGNDVPGGQPGEILVRGDQVCAGYWEAPEATAAAFDGAWFRTGDIGRLDDRGQLYVVDRKKDIIISGGENVASREVEDVVGMHPDVAHVAVVGLPDPRWGETVTAVVVARAAVELDPVALVAWTDGRLAGFKRPRVVVLVAELPLNASGKVDKRAVRELAAQQRSAAGA
jgi:acyl-CoA synthetase (AMP-forming)/AMP-acid ligase II